MTCEEMIEAWDRGELVTTIEMGGLGPGYEQAIQVAAIEFTRATAGLDPETQWISFRQACEEVLTKQDAEWGGLTGAMFGAAVSLAGYFRKLGPTVAIEKVKEEGQTDRIIHVKKVFP